MVIPHFDSVLLMPVRTHCAIVNLPIETPQHILNRGNTHPIWPPTLATVANAAASSSSATRALLASTRSA